MATLARRIVAENGYENTIEVHQTKIEDFQLPNVDDQRQIDIIVSEWMGFYLLHEGMLDSVIFARDKFLKAGGLMFPQTATISLAPCQVPSMFDAWKLHDGVKMESFGAALRAQKAFKPEVMIIPAGDMLHSGTVVTWLDLNDVTVDELNQITFNEVVVVERPGKYQGICLFFNVTFPSDDPLNEIVLDTSPATDPTHWKQTVILLPENAQEDLEENDAIALKLDINRSEENSRHYKLELEMLDPNKVEHMCPCNCNLTKCILLKAHLTLIEKQDLELSEKTEEDADMVSG